MQPPGKGITPGEGRRERSPGGAPGARCPLPCPGQRSRAWGGHGAGRQQRGCTGSTQPVLTARTLGFLGILMEELLKHFLASSVLCGLGQRCRGCSPCPPCAARETKLTPAEARGLGWGFSLAVVCCPREGRQGSAAPQRGFVGLRGSQSCLAVRAGLTLQAEASGASKALRGSRKEFFWQVQDFASHPSSASSEQALGISQERALGTAGVSWGLSWGLLSPQLCHSLCHTPLPTRSSLGCIAVCPSHRLSWKLSQADPSDCPTGDPHGCSELLPFQQPFHTNPTAPAHQSGPLRPTCSAEHCLNPVLLWFRPE